MLILRGSCEVYKIKTKQTLEEFDRVVRNLDEDVRNNPEVYSLLLELRDYFAAMPEGHKYLLGFIGEGQLINIEGLFSHEGASFFSYKVRSPKFEYFNLIKSYLKKYIKGPVRTNLINNLITILKYRNHYIKNKNYILNSQENVDLVDGSLSKLASTKKIKQMLVNDTREELIDCPLGGTNKRDRLAEISMQYFKIPTVIRPEIKQQIREQIRINQKKRAEERDGIDKGKIRKAGGIRWIRGAKNLITGVEKEEEEIARGTVGSPLSTGARHFETSRASLGLSNSKQHIMSILQKHCEFDLQPNRTSNPVMITKPESQARFSLNTFSHKESTSRKNTMPNELSVGKLPTLYEHSHGKAVKSLEKTSHSKLSISNLPRSPHRAIITGSSENIARPPKPKRFSHHYQTEVDIKPMKGLESTRAAQNGDQLKLYLKTPIYSELFRQQYLHS